MWGAWTECNVSCGAGVISRSGTCYNGVAGIDCVGDEYEKAECYATDKGFTMWSDGTECTATYGGGYKSRQRSHICTNEIDEQTVTCNQNHGAWSAWTKWATCSASCGGGETYRSRVHSCTSEREEQTMRCNVHSGSYGNGGAWSKCTATCYGGSKYRSRSHDCGQPDDTQTVLCGAAGVYSPWSDWSTGPVCYGFELDNRLDNVMDNRLVPSPILAQMKLDMNHRCAQITQDFMVPGHHGQHAVQHVVAASKQDQSNTHLITAKIETEEATCGEAGTFGPRTKMEWLQCIMWWRTNFENEISSVFCWNDSSDWSPCS